MTIRNQLGYAFFDFRKEKTVKIGMMNNPRLNLLHEIAWAKGHGFDYLDLTLEPGGTQPQQIKVKEVKKALEDSKMEVVGHTAYYLPLASPYESLRRAAMEEMRLALDFFAELGIRQMTIHPDKSIPFAMGARAVVQKNLQFYREIEETARPLGIQILLENMDRAFSSVEAVREALSRIPQLGFHLDVGHANLNTERNRTEEFLSAFHDRLVHVHFSDNFGKSDDLHLPLGAGAINWRKMVHFLKEFRYDGTITVEVFSLERRYLLASRDLLREIWGY